MASPCGPFTFVFVCTLFLLVVSLAFAGDEDARAGDDVALARSMRSVPRFAGRRGNERIAVDGYAPGGRRHDAGRHRMNHGNLRNNGAGRRRGGGGRRRGGGGGGRRGGGGVGRRRQRHPFSRRERGLIDRLATANKRFSLGMYSLLKQHHPELIFSPYSIHSALTMTYMGARGSTARQMLRVLDLRRLRNNKAHMAYAALVNSLTNSGNVTLNVANAVYVKPNLPIEDSFRSGLQDMYRAAFGLFQLQAVGGPEAPINAWVANRTNNMVRDLLPPGTIDSLTAIVIVNAIHFKGDWKNKFEVSLTSEQPFHRDDGTTTPVQMMSRTALFKYTQADDLSAHIVEIPYRDERFSMVVVLPVARNGLSGVEGRLTEASLDNHLQNMQTVRLWLQLPRFRSETRFSAKALLKRMGMRVPFSNRAQFQGICSTQDLKITDVIHKAVVEVSEEGTEAAAATAVVISLRAIPISVARVRADHPFIYAVRDNLTQTWLFMGKFSAAAAAAAAAEA
ncbi:leukocyte elastase inhibitor-like [Babylonia areolata]|uniref:leukocyte elastase inhibitor-like n=1 Tax=Babylonia areolata TaxID=304850 RepID=UPI003FCFADFE